MDYHVPIFTMIDLIIPVFTSKPVSNVEFAASNEDKFCHYRPRSEGDNVIGSVRPSVRPFVRLRSPA